MNPTLNALAALLHAALLAAAFLPQARADVIPIIITNIVVQKIGPEAELEPLEEGLLYWRPADATTEAGLYYADGETPGGVAVCVGKADYHTLTNDLAVNGHALKLNAHYSLRAEGDSCLLRYGTNIVLRVDGNREAGSTNSLIMATVLAADNDGLTIQANALASDGATIEVTTDLMAVEAWTTATNAAVIESTDVTTTWRITYLDEPYQFYRVFAGGSTPHGTGITAERPLTASQGLAIPAGQPLTMGSNTWTDLPDMSAYAPSSAVASVRADLNSLSWRTTTNETAIDAHTAATNNPHGTTPDGIGLRDWLARRHLALCLDPSEGISALSGLGHYFSFEENMWELPGDLSVDFHMVSTNKTWDFQTPTAPKWNGAPLATGAAVADAISAATNTLGTAIDAAQGSIATNAGNIATNAAAIGALENQLEEYWCRWTDTSLSTSATNWIPTEWPARTVFCYAYIDAPGYVVNFPDWTPSESYVLHLRINKTTNGTIRVCSANGSAIATMKSTSALWREVEFAFRPGIGWICTVFTMASNPYGIIGRSRQEIKSFLPEDSTFAPVIVPQPATLLSFSPSLSPSLSPAIQPATFAPAAFDPEDFPIDNFTDDPTALDDLAPEDFPEDLDDFADAPDDAPPAEE